MFLYPVCKDNQFFSFNKFPVGVFDPSCSIKKKRDHAAKGDRLLPTKH
jgi:hypothetical protein